MLTGQEITRRALPALFRVLENRGHEIPGLLKEYGLDKSLLQASDEKIAWSTYVLLLKAASTRLKGDDFREVGNRLVGRQGVLRSGFWMRNLYTVSEGYSHFFEAAFASLSPLHHAIGVLESNCETGSQGEIRIQIRMRPGYEFSREFFWILQGLAEGLPHIWGMPDCESICMWEGQGIELQLTAPVTLSFLAQLRRKMTSILSPSFLSRELQYTNMALQQKTAALEAKVRELNEARHQQEAVLLRAEMSHLTKSDFLSAMSHELRTPLNGMMGLAELLMDQSDTVEIKDDLRTIFESGQELRLLIDRILAYAQLCQEKSAPDWNELDISVLLRELAERNAPLCYRKGLDFSNQVPLQLPKIRSDGRRIEGVLNIFMANAIKHSAQGTVTLRAHYDPVSLTIEVIDQGPGIQSEKLGELFSGVKNSSTIISDSLMQAGEFALALAAKMAESLHGMLGASSQPTRGSCFTLRLPLQLPVEENQQTEWQPAIGSAPAKNASKYASSRPARLPSSLTEKAGLSILLVEDNPVNRVVTERILTRDGHQVVTANYGIEAIRLCRRHEFDVVLLDICLPGMDGISAGKSILESIEDPPRILAYTASVAESDKRACKAAGFHGFLAKPIAPKDLLLAIRSQQTSANFAVGFLS